MSDELKILIPVEADSSKKGQFISSIQAMVGSLSGDNLPKIAVTLDTAKTKSNIQSQINSIISGIKIQEIDLKLNTNGKVDTSKLTALQQQKVLNNNLLVQEKLRHQQAMSAIKLEQAQINSYNKQISQTNNNFLKRNNENYYSNFLDKSKNSSLSLNKANSESLSPLLSEYENKLNSIKSIISNTPDNKLLDNKDLSVAINDLSQIEAKIKNISLVANSANRNTNTTQKEINRLQSLINTMNNYERTNDKMSSNTGLMERSQGIRREIEDLIRLGQEGNVITSNMTDNVANKFKTLQTSVHSMNLEGQTFGTKLKAQLGSLGVYLTGATLMMGAWRQVKQMISAVTELDTALVELKKVSNVSDSEMSTFLEGAKTRAVELGSSLTDLIDATSSFSRLGYNIKDATNLGETATLYKNVGDDINSIGDASSSIISTMKAFNIEASNSISIIDKLNQVGNTASISSGGLGSALQRSASALATANNDLDESIALIVAGNEVVQDADVVGTALKSTALRIRGKIVPPYTVMCMLCA